MSEIHCWLQHLDGSAVVLPASGALLGQAPTCVFRLLDGRVAEHHARIEVRDGSAFLAPRDGAPCALNGERLLHPRTLRDGDWISLAPGQLLRVRIQPRPAPRWLVQVGTMRSWVSAQAGDTEDGMLRLSPDGQLLLRLRQPARLGEQVLFADGRAWALCVGDVVQLGDGQELRVLQGPELSPPPPVPLAPDGFVRHRPPVRMRLSASGQLALVYHDEALSVSLAESTALLRALLVRAGNFVDLGEFGGLPALMVLRERLISAGADGFSLIRHSNDGASMPLPATRIELDAALSPAPVPTAPSWWLCIDDGSQHRLGAAGVLLGRHEECEVRCRVPYVHRHHAVLHTACEELWLTPLGRHPVYRDGNPVHRAQLLQGGVDLRIVPEARMWIEKHTVPVRPVAAYTLRLPSGAQRTLRQPVVSVRALWPEAEGCSFVRRANKLFVVVKQDGCSHNDHPVRPRQAIALSAGDRVQVGGAQIEVVSLEPGSPGPRLRQIATQSFARQGRLMVRTANGALHRIGLRGLLFQLLLLLLEAAVGSRLRGVIQTQPSSDELLDNESDSLPRGAMRLHDLRLELVADRRLSRAATRALIAELQATLTCGGLDGSELVLLGEHWACIAIDLDCTVDLYR